MVTFRTRDNVLAALPPGSYPSAAVKPLQVAPGLAGGVIDIMEAPEVTAFSSEWLVKCSEFLHLDGDRARLIFGTPGVGVGRVVYELYLYCPAEDCYVAERRA